ncbi:MAG: energy transducer TonB [Prevotellaceae bacterium]|jgi:protein TonB|nr:energy transducer TonB [Prevotellaceae bacterium]
MKQKKSSKASLEDRKIFFLLMGFVMVLSLVYIGLEWTNTQVTVYEVVDMSFLEEDELDDVVQTTQQETPPPPPPPEPDVIEALNIVNDDVETATIEIRTEDDKKEVVSIQAPVAAPVIQEEDEEVIFQVVETMPQFPGGDAAMMKYLRDNVRYPVIAQENGVQGRVTCQFVVNRDGSIVDIEVVRSVDPSLDKEAIRVIQSMPKWKPGQQRGKPVRVKYTLPVNFRLQ